MRDMPHNYVQRQTTYLIFNLIYLILHLNKKSYRPRCWGMISCDKTWFVFLYIKCLI